MINPIFNQISIQYINFINKLYKYKIMIVKKAIQMEMNTTEQKDSIIGCNIKNGDYQHKMNMKTRI